MESLIKKTNISKRINIVNKALALLLISVISFFPGCSSKKKAEPGTTNLVIVLVDALRFDHLGVYGYKRNISPNIDRFAEDALVFDNAISQSGWTAPAIMALFSCDYPKHNLKKSKTFTQWLKKHNYQTTAYATNPILIPKIGYSKGFETYNHLDWETGENIVNSSLEWLEKRDKKRPFYLYLHFMDVHDPYKPEPAYLEKLEGKVAPYQGQVNGDIVGYKELMAGKKALPLEETDVKRLIDLYDAEIAYFDKQFARLVTGLKNAGVYENSIIVFVADHGDEFMDHGGIGHGHTVYEELIHIPLMITGGGIDGGHRYSGLFEMIDLGPTLMDLLGIPLDYNVSGRSFAGNLKENQPLKKLTFSEVHRTVGLRAGSWTVSARSETEKLIYDPHKKEYSLFHIPTDKMEKQPLVIKHDKQMKFLKTSLQQWRKYFGSTGKRKQYDAETMDALRSLGYVK